MEQLTKAPVTLVDFFEETWYEVEVSRDGLDDWYKTSGGSFDNLKRAVELYTRFSASNNGFDYRIVRQTLRSEVVTADGTVE